MVDFLFVFFPFVVSLLDSLFSRIIKLVFSSTVEALLSPGVSPYTLHSTEELCRVRLCVLHTTDHITNQLSIGLHEHISLDQGRATKLYQYIYYSSSVRAVYMGLFKYDKSKYTSVPLNGCYKEVEKYTR